MEIDVDLYLTGLANDSARWKRRGRFGTAHFVEGLLDGLINVEAITREEASAWKDVFLGPFNIAPARFSSVGAAQAVSTSLVPDAFPHFIELIPANQPAKVLPHVCSFQILGVERYDVKGAIVWRIVPLLGPESSEEDISVAALGTGLDMSSIEISDDRGFSYQLSTGSSAGRMDRVGRQEFLPALSDDAKILKVHLEEMIFEIDLGSHS